MQRLSLRVHELASRMDRYDPDWLLDQLDSGSPIGEEDLLAVSRVLEHVLPYYFPDLFDD